MRPQTLAEVAELTRSGQSFDFALRNFLDEFNLHPQGERLCAEPARLAGALADGQRWDAYLAATAETLASKYKYPAPEWVWQEERTLHQPWFALPWSGMRGILLLESPPAFRARNLFVSANALVRA